MSRLLHLLIQTRPVALAVFITGSMFFGPQPQQDNAAPRNGAAAPEQVLATTPTSGANAFVQTQAPSPANLEELVKQSFLGNLLGPGSVDPLFHLPESAVPEATQEQTQTQENALKPPQEEPARSIYHYLVASSDIGFEVDKERLGLALSLAENGEPATLDRLIRDFERKMEAFNALTPPEEMEEAHNESSKILLRYVQLLKAAREKEAGSVAATWDSIERQKLGEDASAVTQKIRDIVHTHGIELPEDVLP